MSKEHFYRRLVARIETELERNNRRITPFQRLTMIATLHRIDGNEATIGNESPFKKWEWSDAMGKDAR